MKTKHLLIPIVFLSLIELTFGQDSIPLMDPPAITKLDYLGKEFTRIRYRLKSFYQVLTDNQSFEVLLKHRPSIEYFDSVNLESVLYTTFISLNDKTFKEGYTLKTKWLQYVSSNTSLLKVDNKFLFLFDGYNENDSCLVLDENLLLINKISLNTIGLVDGKIVGNKIFIVTNDREIDKSTVSVYSNELDFLQSFDLPRKIKRVFAKNKQLIALADSSVHIIDTDLQLREVRLQASSWYQNEQNIIGINKDANTWLLNTETLEQVDLGIGKSQAFITENGYFLVSESTISKYNENNLVEYSFSIAEDSLYSSPSVIFENDIFFLTFPSTQPFNTKFKLLNLQGKTIYEEEDTLRNTNSPFKAKLYTFNSGDLLFNGPSALIKLDKQGDIIWKKNLVDRSKASIFINEDDSFSMLLDHSSFDVLAHFENDEERCRYQAINPVPETLCTPDESMGSHQSIVKMDGNLPGFSWFTYANISSPLLPYNGLGIDFVWYRDGIVDSSQFKSTINAFIDLIPNSTYKVEVKQGNCALMSDEKFFSYADNNEIMQPSITTDPEVIFIGDTVKITGNCENSVFSGDYPGPFPYPDNFKFETPVKDTSYSITCTANFSRIHAPFWEGYKEHRFFPSFGYCLSSSVSAHVIVYDPNTVLATENETPSIRIYPNPAHNYLDIKIPHNLELNGLDIINSNGEIMQSNSPSERIKLDGYSPGIYHIRFKFSDHMATRKFIIN